jgi:hypothetical protein
MTTTRRQWRQYKRLHEQGRHLASQREDLIAAGADPAELPIPLRPMPPIPAPAPSVRTLERQLVNDAGHAWFVAITYMEGLSQAWWIVGVACLAASAGCIAATGAALVFSQALTWHAVVCAVLALGWLAGALVSARRARRLARRVRDTRADIARAGAL